MRAGRHANRAPPPAIYPVRTARTPAPVPRPRPMSDPPPRPPRGRVDRLTLATYAVLALVALLVLSEAVALRAAGRRLRAREAAAARAR